MVSAAAISQIGQFEVSAQTPVTVTYAVPPAFRPVSFLCHQLERLLACTPAMQSCLPTLLSRSRLQAEMCSDSFQLLGMAQRGFLPAVLARRSRHGTPTLAIILSSAGIMALVRLTIVFSSNLCASRVAESAGLCSLFHRPQLYCASTGPVQAAGWLALQTESGHSHRVAPGFVQVPCLNRLITCIAALATLSGTTAAGSPRDSLLFILT